MKARAAEIPGKISAGLASKTMEVGDLIELKEKLNSLIDTLSKNVD